jgi:hypothetical protein
MFGIATFCLSPRASLVRQLPPTGSTSLSKVAFTSNTQPRLRLSGTAIMPYSQPYSINDHTPPSRKTSLAPVKLTAYQIETVNVLNRRSNLDFATSSSSSNTDTTAPQSLLQVQVLNADDIRNYKGFEVCNWNLVDSHSVAEDCTVSALKV